jgi:hypothetical protein
LAWGGNWPGGKWFGGERDAPQDLFTFLYVSVNSFVWLKTDTVSSIATSFSLSKDKLKGGIGTKEKTHTLRAKEASFRNEKN